MKESTVFIKNKINEMFGAFPTLKIRYEFRSGIATHLIEVLPITEFESNQDYILFEMELENQFESLFGKKEDILFVSSDSLNEIRDVQYSLGYIVKETIKIEEFILNAFSFPNFDNHITEDSTSYALAA